MCKGIDELKELHRRLGRLLDDPQPGLMTWRSMLSETLLEMACYAGVGMAPKYTSELLDACKAGIAILRGQVGDKLYVIEKMNDAIVKATSVPASAATTTTC